MLASDLLGLQIEVATEAAEAAPVVANPQTDADADVERGIDLQASLARLERHRTALKAGTLSLMAALESNYLAALAGLGLDHHSPIELLLPMKRVASNGAKNTLPHPSLGPRLFFIALYLDLQRKACGFGNRQASLYRAPAYNAAIGGARFSQHQAMAAADTHPIGGSRRALQQAAESLRNRRIDLTPEQQKVFRDWIRKYNLGPGVFSGSVKGERINPANLRVRLDGPDAGINIIGGQGDYSWGSHRDLRGTVARW